MTARQRHRGTAMYPPGTVLLSPANEGQGWQERALCAQTDPEAFFPAKGGSTREPKKVCRACPVRAECLEYALSNGECFGIWGGLSERERRKIQRQRNPEPVHAAADVEQPCSLCGKQKPISEFPKPRSTNTTGARICRACVAAKNRRITVSELAEIRTRRAAGESMATAAAAFGVTHSCVSKLLAGKTQPAPDPDPDNASGAATDPGKVAA